MPDYDVVGLALVRAAVRSSDNVEMASIGEKITREIAKTLFGAP